MVDGDKVEAVEDWSEVNLEIDGHLEYLEGLENDLAYAVESVAETGSKAPPPLPVDDTGDIEKPGIAPSNLARRTDTEEAESGFDDDFYAAVGAEVKKGAKGGTFCPHCGRHIDADDRFCRRCGHRLN